MFKILLKSISLLLWRFQSCKNQPLLQWLGGDVLTQQIRFSTWKSSWQRISRDFPEEGTNDAAGGGGG